MKKILILFIPFLLVGQLVQSQDINPGADEIYKTDEVAIIRLTMEKADSAFLLDDANIWFDEYISSGYTKMINPSNDAPEILDKNVTPTESKNLITNILSEIRSSEKKDSIFLKEYLEIEYKHYNFLKKTYINK